MYYVSEDSASLLTELTGGNGSPELTIDSLPMGTHSILDTEEIALVNAVDAPSTIVCLVKEYKDVPLGDGTIFRMPVYESLSDASARIARA